jgi:hypothetical protein
MSTIRIPTAGAAGVATSLPAAPGEADSFDLRHRSALGPVTLSAFHGGNSSVNPVFSGNWGFAAVSDAGSTSSSDADGLFFRQDTSAVALNPAYMLARWPGTKGEALIKLNYKVKLPTATDISNVLVFFGEADDFADALALDTHTQDAVGFQYSTSRGDTNWMVMTNSGGAQTNTDTGVAVVAGDALTFDFNHYKGEYVDWWIRRDGIVIASGRVTTNIPSGGSSGNGVWVCTTKDAVAKSVYWYPAYAAGYADAP